MLICPTGWHLPTGDEWNKLMTAVGGYNIAGKYLKATSGWNDYEEQSGNGEDKYGFSALPGGYGYFGGGFRNVGYQVYWWSSTDANANALYSRYMSSDGSVVNHYYKAALYSVRCVRDSEASIEVPVAKDGNSDYMLGGFMGDNTNGFKSSIKAPSARDIDMGSGDGSRSKAEIMAVVNARMPGLRNIYNKYLKLKPGFSGKVILKFTIAPGGDIVSISIVSSTTGYSEFDNDVKNMVATWKWKAIKSGNTTPTIPFNFTE
jgi:TonB family protein